MKKLSKIFRKVFKKDSLRGSLYIIMGLTVGALIACIAIILKNVNLHSQINDEVTEIVRYTMGEYLGEYGIAEVTVNTVTKDSTTTEGSGNITSLNKEEEQAIINSVVGILKPELFQKINADSENIRQQILTDLETKLAQSITETVENKLSETVTLTEEQKQLLVDNTIIIVETKIMEKLRENAEKNADAIASLEQKIQNNLIKIESVLNAYEKKLQFMENSINELKNVTNQMNVESAGNTTNIQDQISILQKGYDSFRKEYMAHVANALTVSNIVTDLSEVPQSDKGVLSAQTGYTIYVELKNFQKKMQDDLSQMGVDINENIMAQINNINTDITLIKSDITKLQEDTSDNYEELKQASATKSELTNAQTSLSQSLELTNQNLSNLNTLTIEKIKETTNMLDQAILDMGDKAGQDLIDARDALQTMINDNVTDITVLQSALNNALIAINNNKSTVDNQLQTINDNIANINNSITGVKSEVDVLKDNQVTFEWSSDENGPTLKIITP